MDTEAIMHVLRSDPAQPFIPAGYFRKFSDITAKSSQPARVQKLPVLSVDFDEALRAFASPHLVHLGWGSIESEGMPILTFRLQLGGLMVYWLANPADEEVWRVMDRWNSARTMVVAPVIGGQALLVSRDFRLAPQAEALRQWTKQGQKVTKLFLQSAGRLLVDGGLARMASSDIAAVPLAWVIGCMVATSSTGGMRAPH